MISDLTLAKLAAAAYLPCAWQAIRDLGLTPVWQTAAPDCSAIIARSADGETVVAFAGTQLRINYIGTILDDLMCGPFTTPGGVVVDEGFYRPLATAWGDIEAIIGDGPLTSTGHSLGSARACHLHLIRPVARTVVFGCPRLYYTAYADGAKRYVHARDPVPDLPPRLLTGGSMLWLHDSGIETVDRRPEWVDLNFGDHDIANYIGALPFEA